LKQLNGNSEVITTQQAKTYMKFVISDELSTHMIEKLTINYGDEIPISDFVENASIFSDMIYNNS
jgi:hypothetical protein